MGKKKRMIRTMRMRMKKIKEMMMVKMKRTIKMMKTKRVRVFEQEDPKFKKQKLFLNSL